MIGEIHKIHSIGRPVLVGTRSVEESERLSARLTGIPHQVLNARHEELEAGDDCAGRRIGRGHHFHQYGRAWHRYPARRRAWPNSAGCTSSGLIGTRAAGLTTNCAGAPAGRAIPAAREFFVSLEDDLLMKYGGEAKGVEQDVESIQRIAEGQNLEIRRFLQKYESVIEGQRQKIQQRRQAILTGEMPCSSDFERLVSLRDHRRSVGRLSGHHHRSARGRPVALLGRPRPAARVFDVGPCAVSRSWKSSWTPRSQRGWRKPRRPAMDPSQRGATWTYLTTDQPFGTATERIMRGLMRKYRNK